MSDEKWEDTVTQIDEKFGIDEKTNIPDNLEDDFSNVFEGGKETIIFKGLLGKMKIERITHPLILNKKMHYHKGAGGTAKVEYEVSKTEKSHKLNPYLWDDITNDWKELDLPEGTMTF